MAENIAEDIDKDTLISLLKEKGKELKTFEGKNKKLEERYLKIFRENKNLNKDKENLEKLLLVIFDKDQNRFTNIEVGSYDSESLIELWRQKEDEKLKLFNETLANQKLEKEELQKKIASFEEKFEKVKNQSNPEADKMVESYKARVLELEKANTKLNQEIKELNQLLEEKSQEISKLSNAEYEIDSLKAELLMKELQIKNINEDLNIKSKMQENERKNEVLRLRHEVENAYEKIKELETEKEKARNFYLSNMRHESVQTESYHDEQISSLNKSIDASPRLNTLEELTKPAFIRSSSDREISQLGENGQINQEYLKNVILKLFCYIEGNNMKEARILMNAIQIMFRMSSEDREKIEEAKKGNTLWGSTVHFIKDTFSGKGDVNYYTSSEQK